MNHERLKNLISVLENVPLEHWNMWSWVNSGWSSNNSKIFPKLRELACGTTGCAFGWYCACNDLDLIDNSFEGTLTRAMQHFEIYYGDALDLFDPRRYIGAVFPEDVILRVKTLLEKQ